MQTVDQNSFITTLKGRTDCETKKNPPLTSYMQEWIPAMKGTGDLRMIN